MAPEDSLRLLRDSIERVRKTCFYGLMEHDLFTVAADTTKLVLSRKGRPFEGVAYASSLLGARREDRAPRRVRRATVLRLRELLLEASSETGFDFAGSLVLTNR